MPRRKSWTVLVYIIARNLDQSGDGKYINSKADEVIERLKAAAHEYADDLYVAYQVVFDPEEGRAEDWVAELLNADDNENVMQTGEFKNPGSPAGSSLIDDLLGFYAWALPRCPADHVATFFWGHSAGPAGLFAPRGEIVLPQPPDTPPGAPPGPPLDPPLSSSIRKKPPIPSLSSSDIRDVLRRARRALTREFVVGTTIQDLNKLILTASIDEPVVDSAGAPVKVDVVLFQDCWMSTLETAFQLKDAAHFAVASQSLVPFGRPSVPNDCGVEPVDPGAGVWPYDRLFGHLRAYDPSAPRASLRPLVDTLGGFYDDPCHVWPNPSVPFTLLDLDKINSGVPGSFDKVALNTLVAALMRLEPTKPGRGAFIQAASLAVAGATVCPRDAADPEELAAGSIALIDVVALCKQLEADQRLRPDELAAVRALINSELVVTCKESIYRPAGVEPPDDPKYSFEITRPDDPNHPKTPKRLGQPLGFQGVSALYFPTPGRIAVWGKRDGNIFHDLDPGFYRRLILSQETDWATLALEQISQP
jgi:hypothetical protein